MHILHNHYACSYLYMIRTNAAYKFSMHDKYLRMYKMKMGWEYEQFRPHILKIYQVLMNDKCLL